MASTVAATTITFDRATLIHLCLFLRLYIAYLRLMGREMSGTPRCGRAFGWDVAQWGRAERRAGATAQWRLA